MLCQISAFKAHCALGFWKGAVLFSAMAEGDGMGHFGRITSITDLPCTQALTAVLKRAMALNDARVTAAARPKPAPTELIVPADFAGALNAARAAHQVFDAGSVSFRREYLLWIEDVKAPATRQRRMDQAIAWLAEGKGRNWKYEKC